MGSSIKIKLMFIYLMLVLIVMIVSGTFILMRIRSQERNNSVQELIEFARSINEQVVQPFAPEEFQYVMDRLYQFDVIRVEGYILDTYAYTYASVTGEQRRFINSAVISALAGNVLDDTDQDTDITGAYMRWVTFAMPVFEDESNSNVQFVIFTRVEAESMYARLRETTMTIFIAVIISLLLTGILGYLFASTLTGPITILAKKAKEIAEGNLNQEISVHSSDEIGQLSENFNIMAKSLNQFMTSMVNEKNKQEIILHNMTDGILAYDDKGHLLHANYSSTEMLNFQNIQELSFEDMMQLLGSDIRDLKDITEDKLADTTVNVHDKFISANFTPYLGEGGQVVGIVIVLQDITKHRKLDNMRKEFVANVSHEIRTPLTTIKSYTETLLHGAMENKEIAEEFLSIIDAEADRITLLTKDLLELSKFDNRQMAMEFEPINLITVLEQSIQQNALLAEKKQQRILWDDHYTDLWILGDAARINQVFNNIINNSIKYSPEGSDVSIYAEKTEHYYRFYIQDSGVGIPKEELSRIFERFYRVDKARSRAMGGTGLGLAIVKEIMEAHNGKITATSEPGKGTTMLLRFVRGEE